ncbi:MAG: class I tRNA ligase family protein, partial [Bacteroidales bacterium]|nr:class I tRNA ligase family protein [Bacteroidales bacterium]
FLGPLEQSKPWDTNGIDGVHRFLRKIWRLFYKKEELAVCDRKPSGNELKILHKLIKKVQEDIESFSFNTSVSAFMIAVNELTELECNAREILEPLLILLSPFAPHICEELWSILGHKESICNAVFPGFVPEYINEDSFEYPVSFNGKLRYKLELARSLSAGEIERIIRENGNTQRFLAGSLIKKIIVVPGKIINIVF